MKLSSAGAAVERLLVWIVALAMLSMMALQFADVLGRKLFDASITSSVELIELMMLAMVFAGLPLTSLKGEHVVFDLLDNVLPRALRSAQALISHGVCAVLLAGAGWLVLERAARTASFGDITPRLHIGLAPFHYAIGVLLLVTAAMHLGLAFVSRAREQAVHADGTAAASDAPRAQREPA